MSSEIHPTSGAAEAAEESKAPASEFSLLSLAYMMARRFLPDSTLSIGASSSHAAALRPPNPHAAGGEEEIWSALTAAESERGDENLGLSGGEWSPEEGGLRRRSWAGVWAKKQTRRRQESPSLHGWVRYRAGWSQHSKTP